MTHYINELSYEEIRDLSLGQILGLISSWESDGLLTTKVFEAVDGYLKRNWTVRGYYDWRRKFIKNHAGGIKAAKKQLYRMLSRAA